MTKFLNAGDVGEALDVSQDHVRHLIRTNRLRAKKLGGDRGDYLVHPVDVARLQVIRDLSSGEQDPLKPDVVWVVEACSFLVDGIRKTGFQPEVIVGIVFGGLFPASLVGVTLRVPMIPLTASHYDGESRLPEVSIAQSYYNFRNVPTLVVDDVVDTGETLKAVHNYMREVGVGMDNLRFATLHTKPSSQFMPNWCVDTVDGWICYPWERCK